MCWYNRHYLLVCRTTLCWNRQTHPTFYWKDRVPNRMYRSKAGRQLLRRWLWYHSCLMIRTCPLSMGNVSIFRMDRTSKVPFRWQSTSVRSCLQAVRELPYSYNFFRESTPVIWVGMYRWADGRGKDRRCWSLPKDGSGCRCAIPKYRFLFDKVGVGNILWSLYRHICLTHAWFPPR